MGWPFERSTWTKTRLVPSQMITSPTQRSPIFFSSIGSPPSTAQIEENLSHIEFFVKKKRNPMEDSLFHKKIAI
ncbi:MAG: hypothetical protein COV59_00100 [Candidatus Magasanikbacteria bacterium CG11_big_fil_rev_8_21_14_0_20_39_34]|uniref:Uncharacterized protein n=1 Tax=Candidatus Magasanikbacteria bacterium CG11_big_fil_rev_8_21_14_0_20_39_34 TaxID=1974653 RepID=A0A2H0N8T1_9BACT|nr:MAG: hypothetical protein COV59_00100 [Candidatus Magasanikbacteria bacterium CG11_big_fil_rev_8_21_14_0_20_39_34]